MPIINIHKRTTWPEHGRLLWINKIAVPGTIIEAGWVYGYLLEIDADVFLKTNDRGQDAFQKDRYSHLCAEWNGCEWHYAPDRWIPASDPPETEEDVWFMVDEIPMVGFFDSGDWYFQSADNDFVFSGRIKIHGHDVTHYQPIVGPEKKEG